MHTKIELYHINNIAITQYSHSNNIPAFIKIRTQGAWNVSLGDSWSQSGHKMALCVKQRHHVTTS